ncbi:MULTISPECIES: YihY/virulence factor BrkB family protein [Euryhalocaulis]|uniref:YihY/virulence factor BrkB family protein n=1 Tax=Euryhalocaulis TaxID=1712422 RepID=UPI0003A4E7B3|nr:MULTISPECIES: YihY/virulence factor BrkB family protein [Euryhalocaulis]MBA4801908.1 YihY/virulence factor BrkB family protein [Euryhalocaulis sp.]
MADLIQDDPVLSWIATLWRVARRTWRRFNGRDVMLFAGGVSFFGLLAVFPGIAVAVSLYGLFASPDEAATAVERLAIVLPPQAEQLFLDQLHSLAEAPRRVLSVQGAVAFGIAGYGAMRGVKALLAGLNRVCTAEDVRGILSFNLLAAGLTVAAIFAAFMASVLIVILPVILGALPVDLELVRGILGDVKLWATGGMGLSLAMLYRFAMGEGRVRWRASVIGAGTATLIWALAARGFTYYVADLADFRATYGSIGAVVVFLMWIYVAAYAVFFGAALATEAEIEINEREARLQAQAERAAAD